MLWWMRDAILATWGFNSIGLLFGLSCREEQTTLVDIQAFSPLQRVKASKLGQQVKAQNWLSRSGQVFLAWPTGIWSSRPKSWVEVLKTCIRTGPNSSWWSGLSFQSSPCARFGKPFAESESLSQVLDCFFSELASSRAWVKAIVDSLSYLGCEVSISLVSAARLPAFCAAWFDRTNCFWSCASPTILWWTWFAKFGLARCLSGILPPLCAFPRLLGLPRFLGTG